MSATAIVPVMPAPPTGLRSISRNWRVNSSTDGISGRIARLAAVQYGVVSLDQLRECGLSADAVWRRVQSGGLHRLHAGVFAVGHPAISRRGRFMAAVKACGELALLSHASAGSLWGVLDWDEDFLPEVLVPNGRVRRHYGIVVHRSRRICPEDAAELRGIPVTSLARTVADLSMRFGYQPLRRVVREALRNEGVTIQELIRVHSRLGARKGSKNLARILAEGNAPTRSQLEDIVHDLILDAGLEPPDVNLPMRVGGRTVIPDFRWPSCRLIVEADGAAWHDNKISREDDAHRQALLEAAGERVLRVTWRQAVADRVRTQARIVAAGAPLSHLRSISGL